MGLDEMDRGVLGELAGKVGVRIVQQPDGIVMLWQGGACVVSGQVAVIMRGDVVADVLYLGDL